MSQADLARQMGVTRNAASKWEAVDPKKRNAPASDKLLQLAKVLKVSPVWLLTGDQNTTASGIVRVSDVEVIWCRGVVEAGVWREAMELPEAQWEAANVRSHPKYRNEDLLALTVAGPSMDLLYPDGTEVIVVSVDKYLGALTTGKRVVALREREGLVEVTLKELMVDSNGQHWLCPRSTDPRFQEPISITAVANGSNVTSAEITHVVIASHKFE